MTGIPKQIHVHVGLCAQHAQISVSPLVRSSEVVLSQLERRCNRRKYDLKKEVQCSCVELLFLTSICESQCHKQAKKMWILLIFCVKKCHLLWQCSRCACLSISQKRIKQFCGWLEQITALLPSNEDTRRFALIVLDLSLTQHSVLLLHTEGGSYESFTMTALISSRCCFSFMLFQRPMSYWRVSHTQCLSCFIVRENSLQLIQSQRRRDGVMLGELKVMFQSYVKT